MKNNKSNNKLPIWKKAEIAMREAVAEVIMEHRKTGRPLAVWQNNKVVMLSPYKVKLPVGNRQ